MAEKGPETRMTPNTISIWGDLFMSTLFWKRNTPPACAFKLKRCLVRFGDCPGISLVSDQGKEIQTTEPLCFLPAPPSHLPFHPPRTNKEVLKGPRWWHLVNSSLFQEWKASFLGGIFLFLLLFLICPISPLHHLSLCRSCWACNSAVSSVGCAGTVVWGRTASSPLPWAALQAPWAPAALGYHLGIGAQRWQVPI